MESEAFGREANSNEVERSIEAAEAAMETAMQELENELSSRDPWFVINVGAAREGVLGIAKASLSLEVGHA